MYEPSDAVLWSKCCAPGIAGAAHRICEHVLAARCDLNHFVAGPEALVFVSLFYDTADVWAEEDYRLVEMLSEVSH